jgi:sulfate/thiosulfate transport system ATP-binding protein
VHALNSEISIRGVSKRFGAHQALDAVNLDVQHGELLALLGPSGSGKTTLLRIIAGLDFPDGGSVMFGGVDALAHNVRDRQVGFVFQHYALFRHMSVFENVAFGMRVRPRAVRLGRAEIAARVRKLLDLVQLGWLAERYPNQLSGGQRQRVALARALAIEPRVLLLDEPFGALDAKVRKELRRWLRSLHEDVHVTSVFVTHDQEEALELADRVVVMSNGRIEQIGTPTEVYGAPATAFVHEFLGDTNRLECHVEGGRAFLADGTPLGHAEGAAAGAAIAYIRPHDVAVIPAQDGAGTIRLAHAIGPLAQLVVEIGGIELDVTVPADIWARLGLGRGDRVEIAIQAGTLFPLQASRGLALTALAPPGPFLSVVKGRTANRGSPPD